MKIESPQPLGFALVIGAVMTIYFAVDFFRIFQAFQLQQMISLGRRGRVGIPSIFDVTFRGVFVFVGIALVSYIIFRLVKGNSK